MLKLIITTIVSICVIIFLSMYKNRQISSKLEQKLNSIELFEQKAVSCNGFLKSDCYIDLPMINGNLLAKRVIISNIDLTVIPVDSSFTDVPLKLEFKDVQYSIWNLFSSQESSLQIKKFFQKYSRTYDINVSLLLNSNIDKIKSLKILDLHANDKFLPFSLSGEFDGLDSSIILKSLNATFDFSKKRVIFDDFVDSMKECCIDSFPQHYKNMSKDNLYKVFIQKINNTDFGPISLENIAILLSSKDKNILDISVYGKSEEPLKQMVLPFLMAGSSVIEKFFDIKIEVK